jgi:flagellar biosynthesis/type III secretory pathway protein FliH
VTAAENPLVESIVAACTELLEQERPVDEVIRRAITAGWDEGRQEGYDEGYEAGLNQPVETSERVAS